ncbi:MFS transporter [Kineosporia rhizophila]|uniref:MFS transporter n=1 Tax=Kineosporia rhizophila TaxID=84633 RepID=UPI001E64CF1C|nr:MFS transporter [Kineosporia rhizophila]MCE0533974.1 MFS transporter [Kineosporia rhizophila]
MVHARLATSAAFVAQGLLFTVLLTHLPQFKDRFALADGTVTLIVVMVTLIAGVGSLASEALAARTSSRLALRLALLLAAVTATVIGTAGELWLFIAAFAMYGIALGGIDAASNMQGVAVQHGYGRSVLNSFHAAWSAAAIAGALYVAAGEEAGLDLGLSVALAAGVVLIIAAGPGAWLLEPRLKTSGGLDARSAPDAVAPVGELPGFLSRGPLLMLGLALAAYWAVDSGASSWGAIYLTDVLDSSDSVAPLAYGAYQALALVSRLFGDRAVQRAGAVTTVRVGALIGITGTLLLVLAPAPAVAVTGFALAGLGLAVVPPLCFAAAGARARDQLQADQLVARLNVFNYLGALLGAALIGAVGSGLGLRGGFFLAVLLAGSLLLLAQAFRPTLTDPAGAGSAPR